LSQQWQLGVMDVTRVAWIADRLIHRLQQAQSTIRLTQEQDTAIAGDVTTGEFNLNLASFQGWKIKSILGTFCHGQNLVRIRLKQLNHIELQGFCPFYL
jgi:CobQ-like glutamine amidotransferase family enzyme